MPALLADYHHSDLFESLQLVFVDRFGWELYRPIGREWFEEGYWQLGHQALGDALARQFLDLWGGDVDCGAHWRRGDSTHPGRSYRMVTLSQARARRWDFILSSVPDNDDGFHRFAKETGARWLSHVGNQGQPIRWDLNPLVILTAKAEIPYPQQVAQVHQEFRLQDFRYELPDRRDLVASFVPCFPSSPLYPVFRRFVGALSDFEWRVYGPPGEVPPDELGHGTITTTPAIGKAMRETGFIWHAKTGDGFGHIVHNAFATGRPVVGHRTYYVGKLAEPLWLDGITCIDVDRRSVDEVCRLMREIRDDVNRHRMMCEAAAARFREVVDFDEDAARIRRLLSFSVP